MNINEIDNLLNEKEQSLKKKIFSLGKMETLVFSDPKLTSIYDDMSVNGEEKYGYHYNETIMNIIFNDYILNSPKFLQKYKMAIPKEKKRRDKSGINKLKNDAIEKIADKAGKTATEIDETDSSSSGAYSSPSAWSPNGDLLGNSSLSPVRKPIFPNGTVIQENYLINASVFADYINILDEQFNRESTLASIGNNSDAYGNETKNMSNSDLNVINKQMKTHKWDTANIGGNVDEKEKVSEVSMLDTNPDSMATKQPIGTEGGGIERGMNGGGASAPMSENKKTKQDMSENDILNELDAELTQLSEQQTGLKNISEDKRTPSLVNVDRMGTDNAKNFKQDMQHSGTKEIINVEKELQWKDQQTDIKDPKKLSSDIEKDVIKKTKGNALENVGNSANEKGNEIPKRNLSTDEQEEVDSYRLGLGDLDYSIKPDKKFEDRMKTDMGDKNYEMRLKKLDMRHNQPMYNKDSQPTNTAKVNESFMSGKYFDDFGKSHIIDFTLNEANEAKKAESNWFALNLNGLGNTYTNKLDSTTRKIGVNEGVADLIVSYDYYVDATKNIFVVEKSKMLSENTTEKAVVNESLDKMKHLFEYQSSDFVDMRNNTRI